MSCAEPTHTDELCPRHGDDTYTTGGKKSSFTSSFLKFCLLRRLRQPQIIFVRDDFASAFLFQFAAGVAGLQAKEGGNLPPPFEDLGQKYPAFLRSSIAASLALSSARVPRSVT